MTKTEAIQQFYDDYDLIGAEITSALITELTQQGHNLTGTLARSVVAQTQYMLNSVEMSISHADYGRSLNTGIPASAVPVSGTAYGDLLFALVKWVRLRKIAFGAAKAYRVAQNIIRKAQKTGFPTPGAYKFSKNGRRTGWIDYTVQTFGIKWEGEIEDAAYRLAGNYMDALLNEIRVPFQKIP